MARKALAKLGEPDMKKREITPSGTINQSLIGI
jgi:hypothetical protein